MLTSLPQGYRALVIGSSGAIGSAFIHALEADPRCARVIGVHRASKPPIDYADESSIATAAAALGHDGDNALPLHLVIVATGMLHAPGIAPEKRLSDLDAATLETVFRANTIGPALVLRHVAPLLHRHERSVLAVLSAKVGSIEDNRLGGWYAYRASKAALNMLLKTAAIEMRRTHPNAALVALHPGTVASTLSRPFRGDEIGRDASQAAGEMLRALDGLGEHETGVFVSWDGQRLPW